MQVVKMLQMSISEIILEAIMWLNVYNFESDETFVCFPKLNFTNCDYI